MGIHAPFGARELAPWRAPEPTEPHPTPIGDALGLSGLIVSGRALAQAPCCAARVSPICSRRNVLAGTAMFALSSSFAPLCRAGSSRTRTLPPTPSARPSAMHNVALEKRI